MGGRVVIYGVEVFDAAFTMKCVPCIVHLYYAASMMLYTFYFSFSTHSLPNFILLIVYLFIEGKKNLNATFLGIFHRMYFVLCSFLPSFPISFTLCDIVAGVFFSSLVCLFSNEIFSYATIAISYFILT